MASTRVGPARASEQSAPVESSQLSRSPSPQSSSKRSRLPPLAPVDSADAAPASLSSSFEADNAQTPLAVSSSLASLRRRSLLSSPSSAPSLALFSASFVGRHPLRCIYSELHTLLTVIRVAGSASSLSASLHSAPATCFGDPQALPPPLSGFVESIESLLASLHRQIHRDSDLEDYLPPLFSACGQDPRRSRAVGRATPRRAADGSVDTRSRGGDLRQQLCESRHETASTRDPKRNACDAPLPSPLSTPLSTPLATPLSPLLPSPYSLHSSAVSSRVNGAHLAPFLFVVADLWPLIQSSATQSSRSPSLAQLFSPRPVVAGALASLAKFVAHDLLAPAHCEDAALLANQIVQAVLACAHQQLHQLATLALSPRASFSVFPPLAQASTLANAGVEEEVVLHRAVSLLLAVVESSAGPLVADEGLWEALKLCYFVVRQPKISGVLRSHTEAVLSELLLVIFAPRRHAFSVERDRERERDRSMGDVEEAAFARGEEGGEERVQERGTRETQSGVRRGVASETKPGRHALAKTLQPATICYQPHGLGGLYMALRFIAFLIAHGLPFSASSSRAPPSLRAVPLGGEETRKGPAPSGAAGAAPESERAGPVLVSEACPSSEASAPNLQSPPPPNLQSASSAFYASEEDLSSAAVSPRCVSSRRVRSADACASIRKMEHDLMALYDDFCQKGKGDEDFHLEMRALGLTLLNGVLEAAGPAIACTPSLRHVVREEVAWAMLGAAAGSFSASGRDASLLVASVLLRAVWNLRTFCFPRPVTEAMLLQTALLRVLASPLHLLLFEPPAHALGPPGTSSAGVQTQYQSLCQLLQQQVAGHDLRFLTLDALVELCALPDFLPLLFIRFDCDVRAPHDLCAQVVALLVFSLLSPAAPPLPSLARLQQFLQAGGRARDDSLLAAGDEGLAALHAANARLLPPFRGVYRTPAFVTLAQDAAGQCSPLCVAPEARVRLRAVQKERPEDAAATCEKKKGDRDVDSFFTGRRNYSALAIEKRRRLAADETEAQRGGLLFDFGKTHAATELNRLALRGILEVLALAVARLEQRRRDAAQNRERNREKKDGKSVQRKVSGEEGRDGRADERSGGTAEAEEVEEREEVEESEEVEETEEVEEREEREQDKRSAAAESVAQTIIASGKASAATAFALVQPFSRLCERRERKRRLEAAAAIFNGNPKHFIPHLEELELLPSPATPRAVAAFLRDTRGLDLVKVGEYLAQNKEWNKQVLIEFLATFAFASVSLVEALRTLLASFRLPGESQQIERIMEAFAGEYFHQQPFVTRPELPGQLAELELFAASAKKEKDSERQKDKRKETEDPRFGIPRWVVSEAAFWRLAEEEESDGSGLGDDEDKLAEALELPRRRSSVDFDFPHEDGIVKSQDAIRQHLTKKLKQFTPDNPPPGYVTFEHRDTVFVLSYSIVMLNTDLHNSQVKVKMNVEQFLRNNRGINQGRSLPVFFLTEIYLSIRDDEIRMRNAASPHTRGAVSGQSDGVAFSGGREEALQTKFAVSRASRRKPAGCPSAARRVRDKSSHASSLFHFLHKREKRERRRSSASSELLSARSSLSCTKSQSTGVPSSACETKSMHADKSVHAEKSRPAETGRSGERGVCSAACAEGKGVGDLGFEKKRAAHASLLSPSSWGSGEGEETPRSVLETELDALFFFTFWEQGVFDALRGVLESSADISLVEAALSGVLLLAKMAIALGFSQALNVIVVELCAYVDLSMGLLSQAVLPVLFEILRPPQLQRSQAACAQRAPEERRAASAVAHARERETDAAFTSEEREQASADGESLPGAGLGGCALLREEGWAAFLEVLLKFFSLGLLPPSLANLQDFCDAQGHPLPRLCTLLPPAFVAPAHGRKKGGRRGWLGDLTNLLFAFADTDDDSEGENGEEEPGRASLTAAQQQQIVASVLGEDGASTCFSPSLFDKLCLLRCGTAFSFLPTTLPPPLRAERSSLSPELPQSESSGLQKFPQRLGLAAAAPLTGGGEEAEGRDGGEKQRRVQREASEREERERQLALVAPFFRFKAVLERCFKFDQLLAQIFTSLPPEAALPLASVLVLHTLPLASPSSAPTLSDSPPASGDSSFVDSPNPYFPYPRLSAFPPSVPLAALEGGAAGLLAPPLGGLSSPRAAVSASAGGAASSGDVAEPVAPRLATLRELLGAAPRAAGPRGPEETVRETDAGALCGASMAEDVRRFRAVGDRAFALEIFGFLVADQGLLLVDPCTRGSRADGEAEREEQETESETGKEGKTSPTERDAQREKEREDRFAGEEAADKEESSTPEFLEKLSTQELVWLLCNTHLNVLIRRYVIAAAAETVQPPLVAIEDAVRLRRVKREKREHKETTGARQRLERQQCSLVRQMLASWGRQLSVETPACLDRDELLFIERLMVAALRLVAEFLPIGACLGDRPKCTDTLEAWIEPSVLHLLALIVHLHPNVYMLQTERISAALQLLTSPECLASLRSPLAVDVFLGILQRTIPLPPFLPPSALPASLLRQQPQQLAAGAADFLALWLETPGALLEAARPGHFQGCVQTLLALSVHTPQLALLKPGAGLAGPREVEGHEWGVTRSLAGLHWGFRRLAGPHRRPAWGAEAPSGDPGSAFFANLQALKMLSDLPGAVAAAERREAERGCARAWLDAEETAVMWVKVLQALAICCAFGPKPVRVKALGLLQQHLVRASSPPPASVEPEDSSTSEDAAGRPSLLQTVMTSPAVWRLVLQEALFPLLTYGFQYPYEAPARGAEESRGAEPAPRRLPNTARHPREAGPSDESEGESGATEEAKTVVESPYTFPAESRATRPHAWMAVPLGRRYTLEAAVAALGAEEVLQRRAASASLVCRLFLSHLDFLLEPLSPVPHSSNEREEDREGEESALRLLGLVGDQILSHFGGNFEAAHAAATSGGLRLLLPPLVQFLELLVAQASAAPLVFCDAFLENLKNTLLVVLTSPAVARASTKGTVELPPPTAADFDFPVEEKAEEKDGDREKDGEAKEQDEKADEEGGADAQERARKRVGARSQGGSPVFFDAALQQLSKSQQLLIVIAHQIISPSFPYLVKDLLAIILPTLLPRSSVAASPSASFRTAEEQTSLGQAVGESELHAPVRPEETGTSEGVQDGDAVGDDSRSMERKADTRRYPLDRPPTPPPPPPPPGPPSLGTSPELGVKPRESVVAATAGDETEHPKKGRHEEERCEERDAGEGSLCSVEAGQTADGEEGAEKEELHRGRAEDAEGTLPPEVPQNEEGEGRETGTRNEIDVSSQYRPGEENKESKQPPRPRSWRETFFGAGAAAAAAALGREVSWTDQAPDGRGQNS
ncbi:UNVERIFIED_CONTAM: Sec7 domain-containing protein [Hammondia hammondi]|eukprot:XP_008885632.1 Sec7 domain-containing protein [Hammondia hammondi]